ncbi:MAG: hypothetical protein CSA18_04595 [Deltaproteobacteria bacterium]|nr:MAG: hypothetical protein CSA18_04595 [Deltaproteobacteria bacterium]
MQTHYKKRHKNKKFTHAGVCVKKIIDSISHDGDIFKEICMYWAAIGDDVNMNSEPISFKNNILTVKVSSSPWIQQLQFMKSEIKNLLNHSIGNNIIKEIRFRLG